MAQIPDLQRHIIIASEDLLFTNVGITPEEAEKINPTLPDPSDPEEARKEADANRLAVGRRWLEETRQERRDWANSLGKDIKVSFPEDPSKTN